MTHLELLTLNYLLNSVWQVPLIFFAAEGGTRLLRSAGPRMEHRIWVAALALETILPACAFGPSLRSFYSSLFNSRSGHITTHTAILNVTAVQSRSNIGAAIAFTALLAFAATLLFFSARLLYGICRAHALRRTAEHVALTGEPLNIWKRSARIFDVHNAQLATSAFIASPSTIGIRRRIVLLPPVLLTSLAQDDLAAALAHEFAHMRRRDFAKNLVYEIISLPTAWHPFLWRTRQRIAESRELVCDELAAQATNGPSRYAHSLLRLAASVSGSTRAATFHAVGMLDANILERRVMALNRKRPIAATSRRFTVTAVVLLGTATCAAAMTLRLEVPAQAIAVTAVTRASSDGPISSAESRELWARTAAHAQVRIAGGVAAGQIISKVNPIYPIEAKASGVEGSVLLHAIIGKDGTIQQLAVISGPPLLVPSAMDAVKQWVYRPYLLNGEPVEVETTITVNYSLANSASAQPPADNSNQDADKIGGSDGAVYNIGGSVRPPTLVYAANPEYPEGARKAKISGNVVVSLIVDPAGEPYNVHVARGLGNELDEKAVEAVQQYRFKPATRNGEPVAVALKVEVNFQVF